MNTGASEPERLDRAVERTGCLAAACDVATEHAPWRSGRALHRRPLAAVAQLGRRARPSQAPRPGARRPYAGAIPGPSSGPRRGYGRSLRSRSRYRTVEITPGVRFRAWTFNGTVPG